MAAQVGPEAETIQPEDTYPFALERLAFWTIAERLHLDMAESPCIGERWAFGQGGSEALAKNGPRL